MPHYQCAVCNLRLKVPGPPADRVGDPCPECGSLLAPASNLAELVGYRFIKPLQAAENARLPVSHEQIATAIDDFVSRRRASSVVRFQAAGSGQDPAAGLAALLTPNEDR